MEKEAQRVCKGSSSNLLAQALACDATAPAFSMSETPSIHPDPALGL
jgi:hypothetical protein